MHYYSFTIYLHYDKMIIGILSVNNFRKKVYI